MERKTNAGWLERCCSFNRLANTKETLDTLIQSITYFQQLLPKDMKVDRK